MTLAHEPIGFRTPPVPRLPPIMYERLEPCDALCHDVGPVDLRPRSRPAGVTGQKSRRGIDQSAVDDTDGRVRTVTAEVMLAVEPAQCGAAFRRDGITQPLAPVEDSQPVGSPTRRKRISAQIGLGTDITRDVREDSQPTPVGDGRNSAQPQSGKRRHQRWSRESGLRRRLFHRLSMRRSRLRSRYRDSTMQRLS